MGDESIHTKNYTIYVAILFVLLVFIPKSYGASAGTLQFLDNYSLEYSSNDDGVVWQNGMLSSVITYAQDTSQFTVKTECYGADYFRFDYCFFKTNSIKSKCDSYLTPSISCSPYDGIITDCKVEDPFGENNISTTQIGQHTLAAHLFYTEKCEEWPNEKTTNPVTVKVINKKRYYCSNATHAVFEGYTGSWVSYSSEQCSGDSVCDTRYEYVEYTDPNNKLDVCVPRPCDVPDGRSLECDCDSDADCPQNMYCRQQSGYDACADIEYTDECTNYNQFFCEAGDVYLCQEGAHSYVKKLVERCDRRGKYCSVSAISSLKKCSTYENQLDAWIDYARGGIKVNTQEGDKFTLNIYVSVSSPVTIEYPLDFIGNCPRGTSQFSAGLHSCTLAVQSDETGTKYISVNEKKIPIQIILSPSLLILTDSEKLLSRYPDDPSGVTAVLRQAYLNAYDENGIVYDLSKYKDLLRAVHPFGDFASYHETILRPLMTNNTYSLQVSDFVKAKCNGCNSVMIVGDDYVVPGYRDSIALDHSPISYQVHYNSTIYTDSLFIGREYPELSNLERLFSNKEDGGTAVVIVVPLNANENFTTSFKRLEEVVKTKVNAVFKSGSVQLYDTPQEHSLLTCKAYPIIHPLGVSQDPSGKDVSTLILIGDKENNPLIKCYPFFENLSNEHLSHIYVDKNQWSKIGINAIFIDTQQHHIIDLFTSIINQSNETHTIPAELFMVSYWGNYPLPVIGDIGDVATLSGECIFKRDIGGCGINSFFIVILPGGTKYWKKISDYLGVPLVKNFLSKYADEAYIFLKRIISRTGGDPDMVLKSVRGISDALDTYPAKKFKLNYHVADGVVALTKHGGGDKIKAVFGSYDKDVAEAILEHAGKNMDTAVTKKFPNTGVVLDVFNTAKKFEKEYGENAGRIFIADPSFIDYNRLKDRKYLKEIEGILGMDAGKLSGPNVESIAYIEIPSSQFKWKNTEGIPQIGDSNSKVFLPEKGVTIGGVPERVIEPLDISGYIVKIPLEP